MTSSDATSRYAIVCAISADHAFALASMLTGFRRHNPAFGGSFIVFHDGLPLRQQQRLRQLEPNMAFHQFDQTTLTRRFASTVNLEKTLHLYNKMIFAKFELPNLLERFEKCLWLDADLLIQGDLADIWSFEGVAWRPLPEGAFARRKDVMEAFANMQGDGSTPLLNGGVVGMGQALCGKLSTQDLYAMAAQLIAKTDATSVDELALYFMAASHGLPLHQFDITFNHPVVKPGGRHARIVHAIGPDKFWNSAPLQLGYPEWAENLGAWSTLGGNGFAGPVRLANMLPATPDQALKAARNRKYWQDVYNDLRAAMPARFQVDLQSDGPTLRLFLSGLPDSIHIELLRQPNERRIGVNICFDDDQILAPKLFARLDGLKVAGGKDTRLELAKNKQGWAYGTVLPLARCGGLLSQIADALAEF